MKRTISLILALILICTLPAMFASDDANNYEHEHDHDHDCDCDHEHLRVGDVWCDRCGNYTTLNEVEYGPYPVPYDENNHENYFLYYYFCSNCNADFGSSYTSSLEGHRFDVFYFDDEHGYEHRACSWCGYDEIYDYRGINHTGLD